jgi:hypothetical protein
VWAAMKSRCLHPGHKEYANYGGRGISVCEEWHKSFAAFLNHVGPRPSDKHSLDRINNDGNYEPGNVRWATWAIQSSNKRTNRRVEIDGQVMTASQASLRYGVHVETVFYRLRAGKLGKDLVKEADRSAEKPLTFQGKTMSRQAWADETGISYGGLRKRLEVLGWSVEKALTQQRRMQRPRSGSHSHQPTN